MRSVVLGLVVVAGLLVSVVGICSERNRVFAQHAAVHRPDRGKSDAQLISFSVLAPEGRQQITMIDTVNRVMSVYHVEMATGEISLRSVRRFHWDLQMDEFNGASPSPRDIRAMTEPR